MGDREEVLDVLVDPLLLESYNISNEELVRAINLNNRLVAAGALDSGQGRFSVKVAGPVSRRRPTSSTCRSRSMATAL